jgi:hypothetical protein
MKIPSPSPLAHVDYALEAAMKRFSYAAAICASLLTAPAFAADQAAVDPDLAQFRAAYTSGDGLAYVVINDQKGDHIYRYGDASRLAAKKSPRGYMVFTCNAPRVLIPQRPEDKAALSKATVVKPGDPRFAELDGKYLAGCRNPLVKSAIPRRQSSR